MASRLHSYTFKRTIRVIGIICFSLLCVAMAGLLFVRLFILERIEVIGDGIEIVLDKEKMGSNVLFVPTDRLTKELLSSYPLLSSVRFEKRLPGTLVIHVYKRQASLSITTNGATYALDTDGVVLDNATVLSTYPRIYLDVGALSIGSKIADDRVLSLLSFFRRLRSDIGIGSVTVRDSTSVQAVMGNTNIILPHRGDLGVKADTLQTIVEGFRIKGTLPTVIDLRFDKPIITN